MRVEDVIKRPLIMTEKGSRLRDEDNQFLFEVDLRADKQDIKRAVEVLFDVTVENVNTLIVRGKMKRLGRSHAKKPNWKKAIVTLSEDDTIDFFEGA